MNKQVELIVVFIAYVSIIPVFALVYYLIYRSQRSAFIFAGEIFRTRVTNEIEASEEDIRWLTSVLSYFEQFASDVNRMPVPFTEGRVEATVKLSDGTSFDLHRITDHPTGGEIEDDPQVVLKRSDGTDLAMGKIVGHGYLSHFRDWGDYVLSTIEPLKRDLAASRDRLQQLHSPLPPVWRYLDFLYFSTITQSTVGYGDILPNSSAVRLVVMIQILAAYGILVFVLNVVLSN